MAIPLIVFVIRIRCYFALFPFVFSDTLAGFSIAVLLVFYAGISRDDSSAIGAFNHWLHGIFYHEDKNVSCLVYCRRIISEKEVKRLRYGEDKTEGLIVLTNCHTISFVF
jgi:hypothetical protein